MTIRQKLGLLTAIPLIAVLVFAALAVVTTGREALEAEKLRTMVVGNSVAGDLIDAIQSERTAAVQLLLADDDVALSDAYEAAIDVTDIAIDSYQEIRADLDDAPTGTLTVLDRIDTELDRITSVRERVTARQKAASAAAFSYRIVIAELLAYRESVPQAVSASSEVADHIRASNLLARSIEYVGLENAAVLRAIARGELTYAAQQELVAANTGGIEARLNFASLADPAWLPWLEQAESGDEMIAASALQDEALRTAPGSDLDIKAQEWSESNAWRVAQLREVQNRVDDQIIDDVSALRDEQYRLTAIQIAGVLLAVVIALVLSFRLGGPVVRGLRQLRETAHRVATEDLPRAVAQLDDHQVLGEKSPEEFAREATPPVQVNGRDELADVGQAFNEVHREAIRVAAHQALLRLHIGAMFVRLARRGHSLSGRLTAGLDEAERNEQDPDRLDRLFRLDHLVTLLGRTNDSLLVLGGASPAKARSTSESTASVLTAAQGQIEQYQQVQIAGVDEGYNVKAAVVDDVVKLLAELLDNATRYSDSQVNVTARLLADRMVIQIFDRGIGIEPERMERLNARLAVKTPLDLEAFQAMGLTVVSHLAALHGIHVELRAVATGGVLAEVSLPSDLLEEQSSPRALPAGPSANEPTPERGGPLFARTRRRRKKSGSDESTTRQRQPGRAITDGSRYQMVPRDSLPVAGARVDDDRGMPILRFDWRTPDSDTGNALTKTAVQPVLRAEDVAERPRRMSFGDDDGALDAGWRAAQRAYEEPAAASSSGGLPQREPMARLVPGAVEADSSPTRGALPRYRDPDAVSATYTAYVRSRAGSRTRPQHPDRSRKAT